MPDDAPLEPRYVVCWCDHCRNGIEFDAVQLAGRLECRVACPHCGQATTLREPPPSPPPPPPPAETGAAAPALPASPSPSPVWEAAPEAVPVAPVESPPAEPSPSITVDLPPDPPPPPQPRGVDVRWLTDLGVVYFRQHQFGEAFLCFRRAAEQGLAAAQFCLAVCYFNGHGTAPNESAALPWLQKAAAQGDANAEFTLGLAYQMGRGMAPDSVLAAQWLKQAATHGHAEALQRVRQTNPGWDPAKPAPAPTPLPAKPPKPSSHELQRLVLDLFRRKL